MRSKTITINGETFSVHNSSKVSRLDAIRCNGYGLFDYYSRPSAIKERIWNAWKYWSVGAKTTAFGVSSGNSQTFTIKGLLEVDGIEYLLVITKAYNKAYVL